MLCQIGPCAALVRICAAFLHAIGHCWHDGMIVRLAVDTLIGVNVPDGRHLGSLLFQATPANCPPAMRLCDYQTWQKLLGQRKWQQRFFQVQRFKNVTSAVPYISDFVRDLLRVISRRHPRPPIEVALMEGGAVQPARPFCCLKPFPENAMMSPTPNVGEFGNACGMCRLISSRRVGRSSRR